MPGSCLRATLAAMAATAHGRWWFKHGMARERAGWSALVLLISVIVALFADAQPTAAQQPVDLELVLAVDVSYSMDLDEQRLQRDGYIAALRDPAVLKAIQSGQHGRIAITYIEWAGWTVQQTVLPWTIIEDAASAEVVATVLAAAPISRYRRTSITGALKISGEQFGKGGFVGLRRVIDVSGDGPNNSGPPIGPVRDELISRGIVINGLPIVLKSPAGGISQFDIDYLDDYYTQCVIGGPGAFMIPIRERREFATATRQKLLLEIAGDAPPPGIVPAQFVLPPPATPGQPSRPAIDCLVGERMWQRYFDDGTRQ